MRPHRLGYYEDDLAGFQRFRRRVMKDEDESVDWIRDMLERVDGLINKINAMEAKKLASVAHKKSARKRAKSAKAAVVESG